MATPPPGGSGRPTAQDVARSAGVSRTTVSFVLNGRTERHGITEATAARVRAAAEALGYVPHRAGRVLQSGRSDTVVFAAPNRASLSTLTLSVLGDVTDELARSDLHLVIRRVAPGLSFRDMWHHLAPAAVVGLEVADADLAEVRAAGVPTYSFDVAAFDDTIGVLQARHLLGRGHSVLAYSGPVDPELATYARRRLAGVRRTCAEAGAPPPVVVATGLDEGSAAAALRQLVDHPGLSAVCAYNDDHAFAVLAGMAQVGLRAPDDLAVIGADNIPLSPVAVPSLTTVDPGADSIAALLVDRVRAMVLDEEADDGAGVLPRVLVRRSA